MLFRSIETPDRPHPIADLIAEQPPRGGCLPLVAGGQHDQIGLFCAAVLHPRTLCSEALNIGELDFPKRFGISFFDSCCVLENFGEKRLTRFHLSLVQDELCSLTQDSADFLCGLWRYRKLSESETNIETFRANVNIQAEIVLSSIRL